MPYHNRGHLMVCTIKSWSNKQEKARMFKSKLKCLLITLFDVKGLVHYEFVPECQTINQHYYLDVLRRLREPVRQKKTRKWHQKNWLLPHDNARPHTAVTVQLYLAKHGIALLPQPPYSPDLPPNDFFLYLKIKRVLKGPRFDSIPEIKENSKNILKSLKDEDFQRSFDIWKKRLNKIQKGRPMSDVGPEGIYTADIRRPANMDHRSARLLVLMLGTIQAMAASIEDDTNDQAIRVLQAKYHEK
ncbi:hypothetical protein LAZ67_12003471 [Cordylochernes scorpioides]|uniref:Transposase n=1 Tax=Cordylochernes scorpioides TaxID=51811 RepID=A0ABY6L7A3_9ARAC|nr:hypothetical protein LAZ67_12003471 [Cordylochernes scorpioides]